MATQIQLRRGTASAWTTANTVLAQGEIGIETDTKKFKLGDGTTAWNSLVYAAAQASHHTAHEAGGADAITSLQGAILFAGEALFTQISSPSAPSAGQNKLYFKSDGNLYRLSSSDVETVVGAQATDANLLIYDVTTNNVSTSAHGFAPKAPNNTGEFLRGDGAWAAPVVPTDATLAVTDNTTNNVSTSAHGFVPKAPNVTTEFLRGDGAWATPVVPTDATLTVTDNTTNDVSTSAHGFVPKAPNVTTEFLRGDGTWATPAGSAAPSDVVGGALSLVSATLIQWGFVSSNQIMLNNGTSWVQVAVATAPTAANTVTDLNGTALAVSTIYDVFAEYSSPTAFNLRFSRWASSGAGTSSRNAAYAAGTAYSIGDRVTYSGNDYVCIQAGTGKTPSSNASYWTLNGPSVTGDFAGLYAQNGILVSSNDTAGIQRRWLGVIYTYNNSGTVNFKMDANNCFIGNFYNRSQIVLMASNSTASWTYSTAVMRECNGGSGQLRAQVVCAASTNASGQCVATALGTLSEVGLGVNSTTATTGIVGAFATTQAIEEGGIAAIKLGAGFNFVTMVENVISGNTVTFYGAYEAGWPTAGATVSLNN